MGCTLARMNVLALAIALGSTVPISWSNSDLSDLTFLERELRGKKVVQLGEATHGGAEFYLLKTKLVRFLHERMGFQVLAIETGALEAGLAFADRDRYTAKELMQATLFGSYRYAEMLPLIEYVKSRPSLQVIGIDPQFSSDDVLSLTRGLIRPYGEKLAAEAEQRLGEAYGFIGLVSRPVEFRKKRDQYLRWLDRLALHLDGIKPKAEDGAKMELLRNVTKQLRRYYDYETTTPMTDRLALRDQIMALLLMQQSKGRKVIVWAHNGHVGRGLGHKVLGDYLRESYGTSTYAFGSFARAGKWVQHWTATTETWSPATDGLESRFPSYGEAWFRPASSFDETTSAFEPENGGVLRFIPRDRFDGLVVITRLRPPTKP